MKRKNNNLCACLRNDSKNVIYNNYYFEPGNSFPTLNIVLTM